MSRTTIASTLRRRAVGVLAIGAAAALVAGCSSAESGAPAPESETGQEETADDTAEEPSDSGGDSTDDSDQDGEETEGGEDDGQDDGEEGDAEETEGGGTEVPQDWAGTVSAETLPDQGGTSYIALNHFRLFTDEGVAVVRPGAARRCRGEGRGLPMMGVLTQPVRKTSTCLTLPSRALT